jgi:hypothetical protein
MNLRKEARGRGCMVRIPEVCNCNSETVVLAHVRIAGISGMGLKAPDLLGAWACDSCHSLYDRRQKSDFDPDFITRCFLEGVIRTQSVLIREGKVRW